MPELPVILAITGSMGSGKSTVSKILAESIPVLDLDKVNAVLLEPDQPGFLALKAYDSDVFFQGELDKKKLAGKMFSDPRYKRNVEDLLHPLIMQSMNEWIEKQKDPLLAVEVPLLFENGLQDLFDETWMVYTDLPVALSRLEQFRGFSKEEALARIEKQLSPEEKASISDVVIYNNEDLEELTKQVQSCLIDVEKRWKLGS